MIWNKILSEANLKKYSDLIPEDFDYRFYIDANTDLKLAGIDNEHKAKEHFLFFGMKEQRVYKKINYTFNQQNLYNSEKWINNSKNILYFSPNAPDYDQSSGGNRLLQILKILKLKLGYDIYFCCNTPLSDKYIDTIQKIGIKTFISNISTNYLNDYLIAFKEQNLAFNSAIFSWYDMARQYMEQVRSLFPSTKIIVDSVDVHWIREERCFKNHEFTKSLDTINNFKSIEKNIYSKADVVFAVTENDRNEIIKEIGNNNIKILSNIHSISKKNSLGNDIVFIGNFAHIPNIKAGENCIEIYLKYTKTKLYKNKKIKPKLYLVGPNPTQKLLDLSKEHKNIIITGKINILEDIYKHARVLMAPLESGAGIKGKICEASMRGLPILTSDIGNEGIGLVDNLSGFIANNNEEFVDRLEYIYAMEKTKLKNIANIGKNHIHKLVSEDAAISCLEHTLKAKHIVISIVSYNSSTRLDTCISSIIRNTDYPNYTIVITDNSSTNDVNNLINSKYSQYNHIIYTRNSINKYFILPNNEVMNKYKNSDIVLINDDIEIISKCWLSYLYSSAYASNSIAAVGGKTIYPNGNIAEAGAELYNSGYGTNKGRNEDPNNPIYNHIEYTGYCSGCLLYMKREAINKIGIFDENFYPMYYEDSEWQYRAHIFGYKTIYDPRCVAIHNEGSSSGTDINKGMKRYQEINRKKFIKKYKNIDIEQFNSFK